MSSWSVIHSIFQQVTHERFIFSSSFAYIWACVCGRKEKFPPLLEGIVILLYRGHSLFNFIYQKIQTDYDVFCLTLTVSQVMVLRFLAKSKSAALGIWFFFCEFGGQVKTFSQSGKNHPVVVQFESTWLQAKKLWGLQLMFHLFVKTKFLWNVWCFLFQDYRS